MNEISAPYSFVVLRYVHDMVTQEFVNVGVLLYSPRASFLGVLTSQAYSRPAAFFGSIDGKHYRRILHHIENTVEELRDRYFGGLAFDVPPTAADVAAGILAKDDSVLRFSEAGGGLSQNLSATLRELFERFVERYSTRPERQKRTDAQVWHSFRSVLVGREVLYRLESVTIKAPKAKHQFPLAWNNGKLNACEAISFDLLDPDNIEDKAARWVGRMWGLSESPVPFVAHLLIGAPTDEKLYGAYRRAKDSLKEFPPEGIVTVYEEEQATEFAERVETDVRASLEAG